MQYAKEKILHFVTLWRKKKRKKKWARVCARFVGTGDVFNFYLQKSCSNIYRVQQPYETAIKPVQKKKGEIHNDWKRIRKQSGNDYR